MLKSRLEKHYEKVVLEDFLLLYNYKNIHSLPRMKHLIFHSSSKSFSLNENALLESFSGLFLATGSRPVISKAHKSIAQFSVRKNDILGVRVTLRRKKLFHLLEKLSLFVIPNLLKSKSFEIEKKKKKQSKIEGSFAQKGDLVLCKAEKRAENLLQNVETRSFSVSGKDTKTFPEISLLLLFFSSFTGFHLTGFFSNNKPFRQDLSGPSLSSRSEDCEGESLSSTFLSTSHFSEREKVSSKRPDSYMIQDDAQALHGAQVDDRASFLEKDRFSDFFFLEKDKQDIFSSESTEKQQFKEQWLSAFQFPYTIKL